MLPHIHFLFFRIPSYSFMMLIGLIAFTVTSIIILEKRELVKQKISNRLLILSAIGFVGMGIGAFVFNSLFQSIEAGKLVIGGITWLGGVLCAFPFTIFLIHKFCPMVKGEALEYFDLLVPGIVLAHGFGRIGCFLGGCCHGGVTDSIFGVSFPEGSPAAFKYPAPGGGSLTVLPTQLFEAVFEFILFFVMILLYKRLKGRFLETYAVTYSIFRFILEFFRGDDRGATGLILTPSQLTSIVLFLIGIILILYRYGVIGKTLRLKMEKIKLEIASDTQIKERNPEDVLRELKSLLDEGVITEEDYEAAKEKILAEITNFN